MSDTPETDAVEFFLPSKQAEEGVVFSDFARTLERQRDAALAQLAGSLETIKMAYRGVPKVATGAAQ